VRTLFCANGGGREIAGFFWGGINEEKKKITSSMLIKTTREQITRQGRQLPINNEYSFWRKRKEKPKTYRKRGVTARSYQRKDLRKSCSVGPKRRRGLILPRTSVLK